MVMIITLNHVHIPATGMLFTSIQISLRLLSQSVAKSHARRRDTHYTLPRSPRSQPADRRRSIMQRCDPTMSKSQEFRSHDVTYEMCPL